MSASMKDRFDEIEREIMEGKHTAASVFTQMRTAAVYMAQPQPASVPDGWMLVPIEPTLEMREAAQDNLALEGLAVSDWLICTTYSQMLAYSPEVSAAQAPADHSEDALAMAAPAPAGLTADDVRAACQNAVEVFAETDEAELCREVAEYMREVLLVDIARQAAPAPKTGFCGDPYVHDCGRSDCPTSDSYKKFVELATARQEVSDA